MKKSRDSEPAASSSTEESDSDASSDEEVSPSTLQLPTAALKKPLPAVDSGSESDDSDDDIPLKKIASKSTDDSSQVRKIISKPNSKSHLVESPAKTPTKRPGAAADEKSLKKLKGEKGGSAEEQGKKSVLFQRLWSDDDEIAILKGVLDYREKKGADPLANATGFHEFVKESLQIDVDRVQIMSKVRRLKKRYENSLSKRKSFNPHDKLVAEFGAKIWGNKIGNAELDQQSKSNLKAKKISKPAAGGGMAVTLGNGSALSGNEARNTQEGEKGGNYLLLACSSTGLMDENLAKLGLGLCREDEKAEIEEKWRKLKMEESEIIVKKLALARELGEMIMAALRSG